MTTETLLELAEIVLKNKIFQLNEKTLKQLRGTATFNACHLTIKFTAEWSKDKTN